MNDKTKLTLTGLVASAVTLAVITIARPGEPDVEAVVAFDEAQRLVRDIAEAKRADAPTDDERQYWLTQRRLQDASISLRELWKSVGPAAPTPDPDPDPDPTPDPDPQDDHISTLEGDAPVGTTGSIGWAETGDKVHAFTSARMQDGQRGVIQVLDTTVEGWKFIEGNSTSHNGDPGFADYHISLWFEPVAGVEYEVQSWVVNADGSNGPRTDKRITIPAP